MIAAPAQPTGLTALRFGAVVNAELGQSGCCADGSSGAPVQSSWSSRKLPTSPPEMIATKKEPGRSPWLVKVMVRVTPGPPTPALQGWAGAGLLDTYDEERRPVFASTATTEDENRLFPGR